MISDGIVSQVGNVTTLRSKLKQHCNMCWLARKRHLSEHIIVYLNAHPRGFKQKELNHHSQQLEDQSGAFG